MLKWMEILQKNLTAFESIVRCMHDSNMGYFSINHPVDRDPICGYTGIIENECPHCHRKEEEHKHLALKNIVITNILDNNISK